MIINQIILFKFIKTNDNVNWSSISYNYKLSENSKMKLNGILYQNIKLYLKILLKNFKIKLIGH